MAGIGLSLKREAVATGWSLFINSATGQSPYINRHSNGIDISFKEGQAKKMEKYLSDAISSKPSKDNLNVNVSLGEVLIPLVLKNYWYYLLAFPLVFMIGRFSK